MAKVWPWTAVDDWCGDFKWNGPFSGRPDANPRDTLNEF
jgi:hypothetical protein